MKQITYEMIKSWGPCYDPVRHIPVTWSGTAVDLLRMDSILFEDRLWVVLRTELTSERVMRLFAVWSYRQTLAFVPAPDPRSLEAAVVAERFANGQATKAELSAARSAARSAESAAESAWSAARSAARSAAESAARSAAESAWSAARSAESAAWSAARSAAWSAARSAAESAWSAARSAARSTARSAAESAWSAARSAAESAQRDKLIEMLEAEAL